MILRTVVREIQTSDRRGFRYVLLYHLGPCGTQLNTHTHTHKHRHTVDCLLELEKDVFFFAFVCELYLTATEVQLQPGQTGVGGQTL